MEALALKYRPKTFDDVVSQKYIIDILQYQIRNNSVKHAYLFTGGAGTGKTTSARIFANAVNNGESVPIEVDAASNTGVDNIREIIEDSKYKPIEGEYKVFVIDECHMLSIGAWNALLKTLEEPPEHTIFVFCTTDPQKIPGTIISRVQRFDFMRMTTDQIKERLKFIITNENYERDSQGAPCIEVTHEALDYIAKLAKGGMRDAITSLDKILDYSDIIELSTVVEALGVADVEQYYDLLQALIILDVEWALEIVNDLYYSGKDMKLAIRSFCDFVTDANLMAYLDDENISIPQELINEMRDWFKEESVTNDELLNILVELNKLSNAIKWDTNPLPTIYLKFMIMCGEQDD